MGMRTSNRCSARSLEGRPAGCSGNPRNASPRTPRKRLDGLRLRCHAAAEGFAAGDKQDVRLQALRLGYGSPHGGLSKLRRIGLLPPRSI